MTDERDQAQQCVGCGRDTRPGTRLFSDRQTTRATSGAAMYLCGDCNERAISVFGRRPGEKDMIQIATRGSALGFGSAGTGIGVGGGGGG